MIRISQIKCPVNHTKEELEAAVCKALGIRRDQLKSFKISKQSIDARKKPNLFYIYSVDVDCEKEAAICRRNKNVQLLNKQKYQLPFDTLSCAPQLPPVIVGTGPAGLFCGLALARMGCCPILLERGEAVENRQKTVQTFWKNGSLNPKSNVQFGEGGAGTFSDGKLNTQVKDLAGRIRYVLENFVEFGADPQITYVQKPHIGTDVLCTVVKNIREEILRLGGQVLFQSQMTDFETEDGKVTAVIVNHDRRIETNQVVLAIGHSARDTFQLLADKKIHMEAKAFAVGLRISHPQEMITLDQYGRNDLTGLGAAPYKVTRKMPDGRGVYSFCMCPGGYVVNASSEKGFMAVNGMSYSDRIGKNANSAMVITVTPEDFPGEGCLKGMAFQQMLERRAFERGNGKIPVQLLGDYLEKRGSTTLGDVAPEFCGEWELTDLNGLFPSFLEQDLKQGITDCEKLIKGFSRKDALLAGVESRTSSPVRIVRKEDCQCSVAGIYPCGEGAGYAGGITSAAVDGLKAAEKIVEKIKMGILC